MAEFSSLSKEELQLLLMSMKKELDNTRSELSNAKNELDAAKDEISTKAKELSEAKDEISTKTKELDKAQAEINNKTKELDKAKEEINNIMWSFRMVISLYHRVYQLKTPHNHKLHIKFVMWIYT